MRYRVVFIKPSNVFLTGEQHLACEGKSAVRAFIQIARQYPGSYTIVRIEKRQGQEWVVVPSSDFNKERR